MARFLIVAYTHFYRDGRVKRHAEALARRGDSVDVICLASELRGETLPGVNVIGLGIKRYRGGSRRAYMSSYVGFFASAAARATLLSLKHRYDVVIVCTMPDAAVITSIVPRLMGSKVVLDVHDTMPELYQDKFGGTRGAVGARLLMWEERASALLAHRVVAVHDLHKQRLIEAGIPADKIRVVMNLPDARIFKPSCNGGPPIEGPFQLVCHGTIAYRLGIDVAIQAMDLLRERIPNACLKIIGDGDYLPQAKELANRLKLGSRVEFQRPVPVEELPAILKEASLGLAPNRASSATHLMLPVKAMEYAVLGIPVVASRLRTIEHYFGSAVRYFTPGDARELADAIEDLYRHPEERSLLARRASLIVRDYDSQARREEHLKAIDPLMNEEA
jgi:glycosyltransferase involved in cell wall biosynthesis